MSSVRKFERPQKVRVNVTHTMQALLSAYLPYESFRDLLTEVGGIIAGGAALAAYLTEHGVESFVPSDVDVWLRGPPSRLNERAVGLSVLWRVQNYLERHGYYLTHYHYDRDYACEEITEILSMAKGDKRIQLIGTREDPIEYITSSFDLSPCITWWLPKHEELETLYPADTKRKVLYRMHESDEPRHRERLQKYLDRGFRAMDAPPLHEIAMDPLEYLVGLEGKRAFDVIALEEVDAVEHVKASRWNILIRVGSAMYAFHREQLLEYLRDHVARTIYGCVYTMPHRQAILAGGLNYLAQSDFTVYELEPTTTLEGHSLYSLFAYTTRGFAMEKYGAVYYAPNEEMLQAHRYFHSLAERIRGF